MLQLELACTITEPRNCFSIGLSFCSLFLSVFIGISENLHGFSAVINHLKHTAGMCPLGTGTPAHLLPVQSLNFSLNRKQLWF